MPRGTVSTSWQRIREYTEQWDWTDAVTGLRTIGFNPPKSARDAKRRPFHIKYVTGNGHLVVANAVCIKVDRRKHMRRLQFLPGNKIEWCRDYLIIEINGTRFYNN